MIQANSLLQFLEEMGPLVELSERDWGGEELLRRVLDLMEADLLRLHHEEADLLLELLHLVRVDNLYHDCTVGPEPDYATRTDFTETPVDLLAIRRDARERLRAAFTALWQAEPQPPHSLPQDNKKRMVLQAAWDAGRETLLALRRKVLALRGELERRHSSRRFMGTAGGGEQQVLDVAQKYGYHQIWWSRPHRAFVAIERDADDHDPLDGNMLEPEKLDGWLVLVVTPDDFERLRAGELEVPDDFGVNWQRVS